MKIVHAVYGLEMGGMEVLVSQLCRIQREQGHDVSIFSYSTLGVIGERLRADGFHIYVPGAAHPLKTMWRYFRRFRTVKPDVVHSHGVAPAVHASISARLAGVRSVISTRHRVEFFPYDRSAERRFNLMGWFCNWVTGICEVTCEALRSGPLARKDRIVRVYNGTTAVVRTGFESLGKRGFTVLFVGRVAPEKAIDTLVRAVAMARVRVPDLALWIVGDGTSRTDLEALARTLDVSEHVTFWGQQMETAPFFSGADVFAMSSISEGLPMSLLQSMSLGTPSILTDVDGMGEVLRLTGAGLLVPVGDPEAMATAMVRVAEDPDLRAQLSRRALTAYQEHFTLERMAAGYMERYLDRLSAYS